MIQKCKNCNKEFTLTSVQEKNYLKRGYCFCSKKCAALYNNKNKDPNKWIKQDKDSGRFLRKEQEITIGKCCYCNKEFTLTRLQVKRLLNNELIYCSKSCSAKVSNANRSNKWKETKKETSLRRYNDENYVNKEQISESVKKLYETRNDYGFSSNSYKQQMLDKYGVENISQSEWLKQHNLEKYGAEYYFQSDVFRDHMNELLKEGKLNIHKISKINLKFQNKLNDLDVKNEIEFYLSPYYYDFKIDDTLIEIDPTATHNCTINFYNFSNEKVIKRDYHLNKTKNANNNGYRCIHIFDWDDEDKIIDLIRNKNRIYARNCILKEIDKLNADNFLDKYHLQNKCNGNTVNIGLYYKDILVQIMTFGKPRYNKNYEWELLRLCSHNEYQIIGGA